MREGRKEGWWRIWGRKKGRKVEDVGKKERWSKEGRIEGGVRREE